MTSERGRQGFSYWKHAVGLDQAFPNLRAFSDAELLDGKFHSLHMRRELEWALIQSVNRPTAVVVPNGQGTTTIARWAKLQTQAQVIHGAIPVLFSIEEFDGPMSAELIAAAVREQLIKGLVSNQWERVIGRARYAELIGAPTAASEAIAEQRRGLTFAYKHSDDAPNIPASEMGLWELVRSLEGRLKVQLLFDQSSGKPEHKRVEQDGSMRVSGNPVHRMRERYSQSYFEMLDSLNEALTDFYGQITDERIARNWIPNTHFGPEESFVSISQVRLDDDDRIDIPPLRPIDLYRILQNSFPRTLHGSGDAGDLAVVLDNDFLTPFMGDNLSISTTTSQFATWCEDAIFDRDPAQYPYQLTPSNLAPLGIYAPHSLQGSIDEIVDDMAVVRRKFLDLGHDIGGLGIVRPSN